MKLRHGRKN